MLTELSQSQDSQGRLNAEMGVLTQFLEVCQPYAKKGKLDVFAKDPESGLTCPLAKYL